MGLSDKDSIDYRIRQAFTTWKKIDETDVRILEGMSLLGPRSLALIAEHLEVPTTTVRYRVKRMIDNSILFLHLNPYHTHMGLKKVVVFVEATPGLEDVLLESMKLHNYWLFLCRAYGPYEGCAGIWTVPKGREENFVNYLNTLKETGVARSFELYWTTCHEGVNVQSRWFSVEENVWTFNWDEWMKEVETIEGELPWTLKEPDDWPIRVDREDLLIIKELEIDGRRTFTDISKRLEIPLETVKYHFREHISKRNLIEGYQVEIYRFPSLISEYLFFKFEFDTYEQLVKFALSLHDKPFPFHLGKVLGENTLTTHLYLPKWEFRKFIGSLSKLIKHGLLKNYKYIIQDMFQTWRETIPYQHFVDGKWNYDEALYMENLQSVLDKWGLG